MSAGNEDHFTSFNKHNNIENINFRKKKLQDNYAVPFVNKSGVRWFKFDSLLGFELYP